jgi:phosphate transport system permease protein
VRLFPATHREGSGETAPRRGLLLPGLFVPTASLAGNAPRAAGFRGKRIRIGDLVFEGSATVFALAVVGLVFAVVASLAVSSQEAWRAIGLDLVSGTVWLPGGQPPLYGALPLVWGTLVTSALAILIGVPVSIAIAIFLSEMAPPWLRSPVSVIVELLAAIPSVVYGLWGIFFLAPFLRDSLNPRLQANWGWTGLFGGTASGYSVLTAGVLLSIMIIPTVSAISREVMQAVPIAQREAAYALGATKWEAVRRAVLPFGRTGLFGAMILGLARAIGETMAVTMVIGNRNILFDSLLSPGNTIPSTLANETYEAAGLHLSALFGLGIILFVVALAVNIVARLMLRRMGRVSGGPKP